MASGTTHPAAERYDRRICSSSISTNTAAGERQHAGGGSLTWINDAHRGDAALVGIVGLLAAGFEVL
jgi:hypothetical protein